MNNIQELKGKRIALVGGAGFIGHNLAINLQSLGAKVSIIDGMQVRDKALMYTFLLSTSCK